MNKAEKAFTRQQRRRTTRWQRVRQTRLNWRRNGGIDGFRALVFPPERVQFMTDLSMHRMPLDESP